MQHYSGEPPALSTRPAAAPQPSQVHGRRAGREGRKHGQVDAANGAPPAGARDPTMNFLTATTLIYAIGAGITMAAGTRLALQ